MSHGCVCNESIHLWLPAVTYHCVMLHFITKTCPCNIQIFFLALKLKISSEKKLIFLTFLLKAYIVGIC